MSHTTRNPDTTRNEQTPPLVWTNALMFALTFGAAAILVPWYGLTRGFSPAAWAAFVLFAGANGMAITAGYHRLWAHRTYEAHWSLRLLYLVFGTMALQNSVFAWCSGHRAHHLHVDDVDRDPYSARRGFWFSHIGWMLRHYPSGRPDFCNIPDLRRDPMLAFQHRYYVPLALATNIGLPLIVGILFHDLWGMFILAGVLRLVWSHHVTFFINSLAHMWGSRPYTEDNSARAWRTSTKASSPRWPTGRASRSSGSARRSARCWSSGTRWTCRANCGRSSAASRCSCGACACCRRSSRSYRPTID